MTCSRPSADDWTPDEHGPGRFGGAQGYVQYLAPDGAAQLPPDEAGALPVSDGDRAIAFEFSDGAFEKSGLPRAR